MNILDRFSTHVRDILARSIQLAGELKNPDVEPAHIFFCLANQKGSVGMEIITRFKINPKIIEQAILSLPTIKTAIAAGGATDQKIMTPLSTGTKAVLEKAMIVAEQHTHNYIGTEHLLAALVGAGDRLVDDILKVGGVEQAEINKQLDTVLNNATQFPRITEVAEVVERLEENLEGMAGMDHSHLPMEMKKPNKKTTGGKRDSALDFFATCLTDEAVQKNIDPVVGRDQEIERVIHILSRRTKNNPLLLGDPGVGKTAIVEGLAKRIVEGEVPDLLLNKKIYSLDMGMLIAGTIYRGEFEGRLRQVIEEVVNNHDIILFIDEIHNIVGAGSNQGTMDAANILKPALSRGLIRCIGATTPNEYKKYIESDPALERRFQPVLVKEPNVEETTRILLGIKKNYETFHNVAITAEAVVAAAKLADRYITSKFLPDKAIDLLDETAAGKRVAAKQSRFASKLGRLRQRLEQTILKKETAAGNDQFKDAVAYKQQEESLKNEIKQLEAHQNKLKIKRLGTITEKDVALQVAKMIGTPPSELIVDDAEGLNSLEKRLGELVVGQTLVLKEVAESIRHAELGLSNPERPLASFLFVGESGVGKTELAKAIATALYNNKDALIKLDMSEFNESFSVSKLLGSPAGYVGYKEGNHFIDKIKLNPYCVILFDEIDKAHKDVIKLLLQMLENGEITDSAGKKISLKHAILILTTSFGAEAVAKGTFGFGHTDTPAAERHTRLVEKLKEHFSPEVINRIDKICWFEKLSPEHLVAIAELELNRLNEQLKNYHTSVMGNRRALEWVLAQLPANTSGAREVRRLVRSHVEELMAKIVLNRNIKARYQLNVVANHLEVK